MIRTFRDNEELYKSEGKWPNLLKVIGQSKISVIILSPRYAESKWCLKELAEIIEHHNREKGHIILPIFYMVHPQDVRRQTGPYEEAFKQHETNDIDEETIRSWKNALNEVGRLKGWHITSRKKEVDVADAVYEVVRSHLSKKNNKLETDELVGIDDQVDEVVDMLDLDSQGVNRFIVTSRDIKVLRRLSGGQSKLYKVQGMNLIHSLQLFCKHAFKKYSPQSGFEALSNAIISTTGGLPLTLKVIGSLLYQEEEVVWKEKLEQLRKISEEEVIEKLKICYDGLRYEEQQIFLDVACFYIGENKEFPSYMWTSCNFHPILYVNILVQRSMLEIGDDMCF
ncbi:Disease resistance protein L6 [Linum perenne]